MFATPENLLASQKASLESAFNVANALFSGVERLTALNLNTARNALEDAISATRSALSVKDAQELFTVPSTMAQPAVDKSLAYARAIYEIQTQVAEELTSLAQSQRSDANKSVVAALDGLSKNAPAGSDVAVAAVKSAFAAANSAFDNLSKAARQVAQAAEANLSAATQATVKAAHAAPAAGSKSRKAA